MRIRSVPSWTCLIVFAALAVGVSAQSLDLRLGQWEYTVSGMKFPPQMLDKLPAASRAQVEEMMKKPSTHRSCLTAEDLRDLNLAKSDDENCKVTTKKITGTVGDVTLTCTGDSPRTQTIHYEALSRESIRGTMKATGGDGPSEMSIAGKWVAAACKE